jgi:hypothetical protein
MWTSFNDNETTSRHDKKLSEENARKAVLWSTEGSLFSPDYS